MADVLGAFEQSVLLAILRLKDDAYGRAILKEVKLRLEREVAAGAVHATLVRLEDRGLLTSRLGAGTAIRGGRARRCSDSELSSSLPVARSPPPTTAARSRVSSYCPTRRRSR